MWIDVSPWYGFLSHSLSCLNRHQRKNISTLFSTHLHRQVVDSNEVTSQSLLFSSLLRRTKYPQPLLLSLVLLSFNDLCCSSLDTFQYFYIFLTCGTQNRNQELSWGCTNAILWNNHSFPLLSYTVLHALQDIIGPFVCQGTQLTHIEFSINQKPYVPFCTPTLVPPFYAHIQDHISPGAWSGMCPC